MALDLVWNELSVLSTAQDRDQVRAHMASLLELMRLWGLSGMPRVLRIPIALVSAELSPGYTLQQWRTDALVNRDQRIFMARYSTKSPELSDTLPELQERSRMVEMSVGGLPAHGILAAWLLDGLSISWLTDPRWSQSKVEAILHELASGANVETQPVEVDNAATASHIDAFVESLRIKHLVDGPAILHNAERFLPLVRFVGSASSQLNNWNPGSTGWTFVLRSICKIQDVCSRWGSEPFPHERISATSSPESSRVWNTEHLRRHRVFLCEDGKARYMEWHVKQYGQNLRIHYDADPATRIVRIGHIGEHLPL